MAFHEKSDSITAEKYIAAGNYWWNSGMFVFDVQTIIEEFEKLFPAIYSVFNKINLDKQSEPNKAFLNEPSISIDYAIIEHTKKASCIPSDFDWNDIGGFEILLEENEKDSNGNACYGNVIAHDAKNCCIRGNKRIVAVGLDGIVVVETEDTILIAKK